MKKVFLVFGIVLFFFGSAMATNDLDGPYKDAKGDWVFKLTTTSGKDVYGCETSSNLCYRIYENHAFVAYNSNGSIAFIGD